MFDVVVDTIMSQGCLNQSVNGSSDTEVEIEGNGELMKEVRHEWYAVHITEGFHKGVDGDMGAVEVCQLEELKCLDGDRSCWGIWGTWHKPLSN